MTPRQTDAYNFIAAFIEEQGYSPSYREMAEALSIQSKSGVHRLVCSLEASGMIVRSPKKARSIMPAPMVIDAHVTSARNLIEGTLSKLDAGEINTFEAICTIREVPGILQASE